MVEQHQAFKTKRSPAITFQMVKFPNSWPKADSAKCCIFEAINLVGKAKFGPEWTMTELSALYWAEQPKDAEARWLASRPLAGLLRKPPPPEYPLHRRGIIVPKDLDHNAHVGKRKEHLAEVAHEKAVTEEQALWEQNDQSLMRLVGAVEWLAHQCRDGVLQAYYRFQIGGDLFPMAAADWNCEYPLPTFVAEAGYKRWFLNQGQATQHPVYIFFDRSQVIKAASTLAHAELSVALTSLDALSPYLKLAVKLALAKGYNSPAAAESQPVREAEVTAAWNASLPDVPVSQTAIEAIAKVMGFPNPTAILQGKRGGSGKKGSHP